VFADDLAKRWERFAEAANKFAKRAALISPASPDFEERVKEQFYSRGLGEKFRDLEELMRNP